MDLSVNSTLESEQATVLIMTICLSTMTDKEPQANPHVMVGLK